MSWAATVLREPGAMLVLIPSSLETRATRAQKNLFFFLCVIPDLATRLRGGLPIWQTHSQSVLHGGEALTGANQGWHSHESMRMGDDSQVPARPWLLWLFFFFFYFRREITGSGPQS